MNTPSVIVIDNIDALYENDNEGKHALNYEMDRHSRCRCVVIGITRNIDAVEPHMRRFGRF